MVFHSETAHRNNIVLRCGEVTLRLAVFCSVWYSNPAGRMARLCADQHCNARLL